MSAIFGKEVFPGWRSGGMDEWQCVNTQSRVTQGTEVLGEGWRKGVKGRSRSPHGDYAEGTADSIDGLG